MKISQVEKLVAKFNNQAVTINDFEQDDLDFLKDHHLIQDGKLVKMDGLFVGQYVQKSKFGFVDCKEESFFIKNSNNSLNNDYVIGKVIKSSYEKPTGEIIATIERNKIVNNQVQIVNGRINPTDKTWSDREIILKNIQDYQDNDYVEVEIIEVTAKVITVNGIKKITTANHPDKTMALVLNQFKIPGEFSASVLQEGEQLKTSFDLDAALKTRKDLTTFKIITIDGSDAKDLDDAVFISKTNKGYKLLISIADVSYFIQPGSELDQEAFNRGTSTYFLNKVIPMLPEVISNDLCSLNEAGIKLTLTCELILSNDGKIITTKLYESYLKSYAQLTYSQINDYYANQKSDNEKIMKIGPMLDTMLELSQKLSKIKKRRGELELIRPETEFVFDKNNHVIDLKIKKSGLSEKVIEDFMVLANEAVAQSILKTEKPGLYRIHSEPAADKIIPINTYLKNINRNLEVDNTTLDPKIVQHLIDTSDPARKQIISEMLLFAMSKATYSPDNIGHFGLASKHYTHFTSPIRRYPDLIVHRLIKQYFLNQEVTVDYSNLPTIAKHSSTREYLSTKAEQKIADHAKVAYISAQKPDKIYDAIIVKISPNGMFVELDNTIRGLIAARDMIGYFNKTDDFTFESRYVRYRIGAKIKVKIKRLNLENDLIDFVIVGQRENKKFFEKKDLSGKTTWVKKTKNRPFPPKKTKFNNK